MAHNSGMHSLLATMRATPVPLRHATSDEPQRPAPFVTISREGGAGGHTFAQTLVGRLNDLDPGSEPWTLWDRTLVEKTACDHHLTKELVQSLGEAGRTWMEEFLSGLSFGSDESEAHVYQAVARTIRALAIKSRAVIVGRGGVYITRNMPGGIHLRLVAPLDARVRNMAEQLHLSNAAALAHVHQLDRQRQAFYRRYWPKEILAAETFTLTINTAMVTDAQAVKSVLPLILPGLHAALPERTPEAEMAVS